jgi:hypothetical protein
MDGNFCAEHLKMRKPEDDVALTDGDSFFTSVNDYDTHLAESVEAKQVNWYYVASLYTDFCFRDQPVIIMLLSITPMQVMINWKLLELVLWRVLDMVAFIPMPLLTFRKVNSKYLLSMFVLSMTVFLDR